MKIILVLLSLLVVLAACNPGNAEPLDTKSIASPTIKVVQFSTPTSRPVVVLAATPVKVETDTPTPLPTNTPVPSPPITPLPITVTPVPEIEAKVNSEPSPVAPVVAPADTSPPEVAANPDVDFMVRYVRLRTNQENSWDGTLGPGNCGSDHSIYVNVADAQENLLDGVLIGDRYGNFEVPTGVDGPGVVRILVWSATMEVAVMGHQDGTRYTSSFAPPLSTVDEDISLEWLQQAGYCESPEDCRWRVENNQLCRGHYSYDVIFQRTW